MFEKDAFAGRRVVVTGGSSGIGLAIAKAFAQHGAQVHLVARDPARLRAAQDQVPATIHSCDVRDEAAVAKVAKAVAEAGGADILVNAAAGNFPVPFDAMSANAWKAVVGIVLDGTVHMCRAFSAQLHAAAEAGRQPAVVNIVAGYAWTGAPGVSHSGAAKAAVLNLTKSLAVEWAPVRVNAVSPGPIAGTEGMRRLGDELGLTDALVKTVPLRRMGRAEEVAAACLFLAGASYITGQCLAVDGGQDAVGPFGGLWAALQG